MPLRTDSSLWFNMPGCVAAWQPVRAPNPKYALYNQVKGGSNRYPVTHVAAPVWSCVNGWRYALASVTKSSTTVIPSAGWSMIAAFQQIASGNAYQCLVGATATNARFELWPKDGATLAFANGGVREVGTAIADGATASMAVAGQSGYKNGLLVDSSIGAFTGTGVAVTIGVYNVNTYYWDGYLYSLAIYNRTLSPAEVYQASRQMVNCMRNPDWSAWGRRREWFIYSAPVAGGNLLRHPGMTGNISGGLGHNPGMSGGIDG